jgi:ArsR family transcriptional regulator, arsenate/arsenite/antimonite-responsive transcriptional repressor
VQPGRSGHYDAIDAGAPSTRATYFDDIGNMERIPAIAALAALAQESRLDIFRLLVEAGPAGLPAGRIGERLDLPPATLSFHLNQLRHAGLVSFRRESRSLIYAAEYGTMNDLLGYLTENCCRGDAAACAVSATCEPTPLSPQAEGAPHHEAPARQRRG